MSRKKSGTCHQQDDKIKVAEIKVFKVNLECKLGQPLWKTVWRFIKKLKMELPYNPAIPLQGLYPEKMKTLIQKDTCTPMFTAALFTTAKTWKQPNCTSTDSLKKMWNIYTTEYYSARKKNEICHLQQHGWN